MRKLLLLAQKHVWACSSLFDPSGVENLGGIEDYLAGVEVSVFIRQKEENSYKISLRSGNKVNVSDVCLMFGGGGHPRAAGANVQGNVEQVKEKVLKEVRKALESEK